MTGVIRADVPTTKSILKILLPTILPTAISALPLTAAVAEVTSLGLGLTDNVVAFTDGLILWALMICYLLYLLRMAKHGGPLTAAVAEVTSSGSDVPKATIVRPIRRSLMPKMCLLAGYAVYFVYLIG